MAQEREKGDVKIVENKRPSDTLVKRGKLEGLIERRVSQKQAAALQDGRNGVTGMIGFLMHTVNGIVPVEAESNKVIPDKDNTIGIAKFDPALIKEKDVDELLKKLA